MPIDIVTGECFIERTDFFLDGPIPLEWETYYSNQLESNGPLGHQWGHAYHCFLKLHEKHVVCDEGLGVETLFISTRGDEAMSADRQSTMKAWESDGFEISFPKGKLYRFRKTPSGDSALLEEIANASGQSVSFHYDRHGNLQKIVDSANRILDISLDQNGRILSVECHREDNPDMRIRLVEYRYDRDGNLAEVCDANGHRQHYEYDNRHQILKRTDRNGHSFLYRYDDDGRCVQSGGDDGLFAGKFIYEPENRRTFFIGPDERRIEYRYDKNEMVTDEIDPYGRPAKTHYDMDGNVAATTDRCRRANVFQYDDKGSMIKEIGATGTIIAYAYNEQGQIIEKAGPGAKKKVYEYDEFGNPADEEDDSDE